MSGEGAGVGATLAWRCGCALCSAASSRVPDGARAAVQLPGAVPDSGNVYLDALLWGNAWGGGPPVVVTYSFIDDPNWDNDRYYTWGAEERAAMRAALATWSAVAAVTFVEEPSGAGDLTFFSVDSVYFGGSSTLGRQIGPDGGDRAGQGWFNRDGRGWTTAGLAQGGYGFVTLIHEVGHAVGLAHPHDRGGGSSVFPGVSDAYDVGDDGLNQGVFTTMSYNRAVSSDGAAPTAYGNQGTPMAFDIAAVQRIYGPNMANGAGDDTYVLPNANAAGTFYRAIWDAGGTDTVTYGGTRAVVIDLRAAPLTGPDAGGYISRAAGVRGGFTVAAGVTLENASAGGGADRLTGNDAANRLDGGAGNDTLDGGGGADTVAGGDGDDWYVLGDGDQVADFSDADRLLVPGFGPSATLSVATVGTATVLTVRDGARAVTVTLPGTGYAAAQFGAVATREGLRLSYAGALTSTVPVTMTTAVVAGLSVQTPAGASVAVTGAPRSVAREAAGATLLDAVGAAGLSTAPGTAAAMAIDAYAAGLPAQEVVTVRTVRPSVGEGGGPAAAIVMSGSGGVEALVLDARGLSSTATVQVDLVGFLAVVGSARVEGGQGAQVAVGDDAAQVMVLGDGDDTLRGGGGDDFVGSREGDDVLYGDAGNDTLTGGVGDDILYGNTDGDQLYGNLGLDTLFGGQGTDTLFGGQDGDVLYGQIAADALYGQIAADTLFGGQGADTLFGGQGGDLVFGNRDGDALYGNLGDDTLDGGQGMDILHGGDGADLFRIATPADGGDTVLDFEAARDRVAVTGPNFGAVATGVLDRRHFALDRPDDGDDWFVFDTATGVLSFDADGAGAGAGVVLATLNVRTLSHTDIVVLAT